MNYCNHSNQYVNAVPSHIFWRSFGLTVLLFLLGLFFFKPYFLVNDDLFILFITKGTGIALSPDPHVFFSHILFSMPLCYFYRWFPNVPWYPSAILAIQFFSFWALSLALTMKVQRLFLPVLFFLLFFMLMGVYNLQHLNLTLTSGLAFQCGFFLLLRLIDEPLRLVPKRILTLGCFCVLSSLLLRTETFPLFALTAVPFLFEACRRPESRKRVLLTLCLTTGILAGALLLQRAYYSHPPEWDHYRVAYPLNRQIHDFYPIDYNKDTQPFFDKIGWSSNDFSLFYGWYYWDTDLYSAEKFAQIGDHFSSAKSLREVSRHFWKSVKEPPLLSLLCCLLLTSLFIQRTRFRFFILCVCWGMVLWFSLSVWFKTPERIIFPLVSFLILSGIFCSLSVDSHEAESEAEKRPSALVIVLGCLLSISSLWYASQYDHSKHLWEKFLKKGVTALQPRSDQLFLVWDSILPFEDIGAFDDMSSFRDFRLFSIAAYQQSPIGDRMLAHFNLKNPLRDAVDRPDIFLICNPYEGLMAVHYLQEKYGIKAGGIKVFACPSFNVYQLKSLPLKAQTFQ